MWISLRLPPPRCRHAPTHNLNLPPPEYCGLAGFQPCRPHKVCCAVHRPISNLSYALPCLCRSLSFLRLAWCPQPSCPPPVPPLHSMHSRGHSRHSTHSRHSRGHSTHSRHSREHSVHSTRCGAPLQGPLHQCSRGRAGNSRQ